MAMDAMVVLLPLLASVAASPACTPGLLDSGSGSYSTEQTNIRWTSMDGKGPPTICLEVAASVNSSSYISVGFSPFQAFGPAPMVGCSVAPPHSFPLYWHFDKASNPVAETSAVMDTVVNRTAEGATLCYITLSAEFSVRPFSSSPEQEVNLGNQSFFLVTAAGPVLQQGVLG